MLFSETWTSVKMDRKLPYVSQSQPLNEASGGASDIACDDELPQNNFQTMKAANDTTKVCI